MTEIEIRGAPVKATADESRLADLAEVSIPIAHEFNNFLNSLLLHTAALKLQLPEETHEGLIEIRRQALAATALIQQFQHYRQRQQPSRLPVDLNQAVQDALETLSASSLPGMILPYGKTGDPAPTPVHVRLDLAPEALLIIGGNSDMKRLCIFLLRNAAAAAHAGQISVQTFSAQGKIILKVEDAGPPVSREQLAHLFEPSSVGRDGTSSLELAACKTITRRLGGAIHAEMCSEGGVTIVVEWDAAGL